MKGGKQTVDTERKIEMSKFLKEKQSVEMDPEFRKRHRKSEPTTPAASKPHFKIDWRQLTYYQKSDSYSGRILSKLRGTFSNKSNNQQSERNSQTIDGASIHSAATLSSDDSHFSAGSGCQSQRSNVGHKSYKPKRILNSLDGSFRSGELSAILGPSGAGKSTFLSTLFGAKQEGAYGHTKVTWFVDSAEGAKSMSRRRLRTVFLPQHDHLLHHLTVYETLLFASKIKNTNPQSTSGGDCELEQLQGKQQFGSNFHRQNVKRVAKMLKLNDCLDTRCGRLSGGQYKRVSIAQELLSNPDVMILDEPTSGLDAMTCLTTILTLKSIVTKHPMSIILTIHQPDVDVFNIFDHIYVIAQGGLAIYEGPPRELVPTLAELDLNMPSAGYNPARFIVENAFLVPEADSSLVVGLKPLGSATDSKSVLTSSDELTSSSSSSDGEDGDDDDDEERERKRRGYIKRSVVSLTEVISGKEMVSPSKRDKKPLLNIGIRTLDGKLITSEQLAKKNNSLQEEQYLSERWNLLKRLNQLQKAKYYGKPAQAELIISVDETNKQGKAAPELSPCCSSGQSSISNNNQSNSPSSTSSGGELEDEGERKSAKSDYSSAAGWSEDRPRPVGAASAGSSRSGSRNSSKAISLAQLSDGSEAKRAAPETGRSLQNLTANERARRSSSSSSSSSDAEAEVDQFVLELGDLNQTSGAGNESVACSLLPSCASSRKVRLRRQFDKRLSSRHNSSKYRDYPIWNHALVLTHRTWLSIIRDPIFFGIQAVMHTTIPILLSLIFGSTQEEGCPRIGSFDLVEFAYSDSDNMIQGTVKSIRQSIGNIGIVFFEMFVLSFSINCITALVFPLDMHVLLKEYRNGWYSLRSYFIGRTLADLPVPIVLHSIGMSILYFLTGQPSSIWRYSAIIVLVILSSLVAQSVGLTIGALLMESSQSAVLAAAGIVAPFFALSGFIVRIHTLPVVAQVAAKVSYLYYLLNGFIIVRYGFGRCQCKEEDFETNDAHQIPSNLHTMASMWIGTYSNEFTDSSAIMKSAQLAQNNRTNIDPNIDVVDKMMTAFKMANSYGHKIDNCSDVLPYAMLDFNLRDNDVYKSFVVLVIMLIVSRFITFSAIYYKIRSFA